MVRVTYTGLVDPKAGCLELKPYRDALIRIQGRYRPFGPEYKAINGAISALDDAVGALCGDRELFHLKLTPSQWRPPNAS